MYLMTYLIILTAMDFKDVNLRFELKTGDVCVCRLHDEYFYYQVNIVLCVYENGHFYDILCKEENIMPKEDHCLTNREVNGGGFVNMVVDYCFTGYNVKNIYSPVKG